VLQPGRPLFDSQHADAVYTTCAFWPVHRDARTHGCEIFQLAGTDIAIKISPHIINRTAAEDVRAVESLEMLRHERAVFGALAAAKPYHPNIVQ
jgi:hypothetical protein